MKNLVLLFCFPWMLVAQPALKNAESMEIEWKSKLPGYESSVTSILLHSNQIYLTETQYLGISFFSIYSKDGELMHTANKKNRLRTIMTYENSMYLLGDHKIIQQDFQGNVLDEKPLYWRNGEKVNMPSAGHNNNSVYTFFHNDLLKYSLITGEQLFLKNVAEICGNQKVCAGGNYVYAFALIDEPDLGNQLMQFDTVGNLKWRIPAGDVRAMIADENGYCYIAPLSTETSLEKLNTNGEVIWSIPLSGQFVRGMSKRGDSIFVCGNISLSAAAATNKQSCAYSIVSAKTGVIISQQTITINQAQNVPEEFTQIASDGKNIYLGGSEGNQSPQCFLLKLSKEGNTTGLGENNNTGSFSIFPNPSGSKFTISCDNIKSKSLTVTVRNTLGQVVQRKELSCEGRKSWELDLSGQKSGNYTVEILSGEHKVVKKIVVE